MNKNLDDFGEFIVQQMRDKGIEFYDKLEKGSWRAPSLMAIQESLNMFEEEQLVILRKCVIETLDTALHDFLFALQENHENEGTVQLLVNSEDIAGLSDGLNGELFSEDGWISKYSKYRE